MRNPLDRIRRLRREARNRRDVEAHVPPGPPTHNIRDVAGLPTADGRRTRAGILLRGDAPFADDGPDSPGWPRGLAWPPGVALDLRGDRELDHPYPLAGTRWIHLPLIDTLAPELLTRDEDERIGTDALYLALLDSAPAWLPTLFDAALDGPHPVLVHCAAGKDRTGVAIAVLLRLAGVTRAAVDADFTRTNARRIGLQRRLERRPQLRAGVVPAGDIGVTREHILGVLDRLDGDGAREVARAAGLPDDRVEQWRDLLLDQPGPGPVADHKDGPGNPGSRDSAGRGGDQETGR